MGSLSHESGQERAAAASRSHAGWARAVRGGQDRAAPGQQQPHEEKREKAALCCPEPQAVPSHPEPGGAAVGPIRACKAPALRAEFKGYANL